MYYHVAVEGWDGKDLQCAVERYGGETEASQMFLTKWPDASPEMADNHIHHVFLFETIEEAREHQHNYGGDILAISPEVEARKDGVEGYLCVWYRIGRENILGIVS